MIRALATIDLGAVRANVGRLRSLLAPGVGLIAVVKADAYGHGALPVARAALEAGATGLAVTTVEEGAELRGGFVHAPLLLLGPVADDQLEEAARLDADLAAWSPHFVRALSRVGASRGRRVRIHVKIDTGMRRLGVTPDAFRELVDLARQEPGVELAAVMTHFATADDDPEFMEHQRRLFLSCVEPVRAAFPAVWAHAANSAATFRDPQSHFDAVRCGIAVYGLSPFQGDPDELGLRPVLSLTSYVAHLQPLAVDEGVSYNLTWRAPRGTRVALVPVGYGDGFSRALSNRGDVLIRGRRYPRVGTVCMDQFLTDVGPENGVTFGDAVTLIGRNGDERVTAEELAGLIGTINYEVTCSLTSRVRRRYTAEEPGKGTGRDG